VLDHGQRRTEHDVADHTDGNEGGEEQ
jgi:hypothetical protein